MGPLNKEDTEKEARKQEYEKTVHKNEVYNKSASLARNKKMQDLLQPLGEWYIKNYPNLPIGEYNDNNSGAWKALKQKASEMYPDKGDPNEWLNYYYFTDIGNAAAGGGKDVTRPYRQYANYVTNPPEQRGADDVRYYREQDAANVAQKNARAKEAYRQHMLHAIENENKNMHISRSIIEGVGEWR